MTEVVLVSGADQTRIRKLCELYLQHKGTDYDVLWKTRMTTGCQMPTWLGPAALLLPGPQPRGLLSDKLGYGYSALNQRGPSRSFTRAQKIDSTVDTPDQRDPEGH